MSPNNSGDFLESKYFCARVICLVTAFGLAASQHELGGPHRFALPIGKVPSKKNTIFASSAKYAKVPSLIHRAWMT